MTTILIIKILAIILLLTCSAISSGSETALTAISKLRAIKYKDQGNHKADYILKIKEIKYAGEVTSSQKKKFSKNPKIDLLELPLFPKPVSVISQGNSFNLNNKTKILVLEDSKELLKSANYLATIIKPSTGFDLTVESVKDEFSINCILLNNTTLFSFNFIVVQPFAIYIFYKALGIAF